jgi:DNA end-binding protein Ku
MATSVWKGHIAFGLVSVPVKLCCAARGESVSFCQLRTTDLSRVGQKQYAKADDAPITKDEIVKGYELGGDRYVVVTEAELKAMAPSSSDVAEIVEFVPSAQVDPIGYEASYWLAPDKGGDKAYSLLYNGLRTTGYVGIAKLAMGSREHVIALRAGKHGIAVHTLFYAHEVRASDEFHADLSRVTDQESQLAGQLIQALASTFELDKYRDTYRENVLALIESKQAGTAAPAPAKPAATAASGDLMEALRASLTAAKPALGPVAVPSPVPAAAPRAKRRSKTEVAA